MASLTSTVVAPPRNRQRNTVHIDLIVNVENNPIFLVNLEALIRDRQVISPGGDAGKEEEATNIGLGASGAPSCLLNELNL